MGVVTRVHKACSPETLSRLTVAATSFQKYNGKGSGSPISFCSAGSYVANAEGKRLSRVQVLVPSHLKAELIVERVP